MLHLFSKLLKDYLVQHEVAVGDNFKFGAPDQNYVQSLPMGKSVNIYLVEINENRKLRGNERQRSQENGKPVFHESLYPAWIDAHFLISVWDTAKDLNAKALSEQETLDSICSLLLAGDPFSPRIVYPGPTEKDLVSVETVRQQVRDERLILGDPPEIAAQAGDLAAIAERDRITEQILAPRHAWPKEFHEPGLPYRVMPPEGFPKLSEFWTTMGTGSPWKPLIYLVASIPVGLKPAFESPMVTTLATRIGQTANAPARELIDADPHHYVGVPQSDLSDEERAKRFRDEGTVREWKQIGGTVRRKQLDEKGRPVLVLDPVTRKPVIDPVTNKEIIALTPVPGVKVRLEMAVTDPSHPEPAAFSLLQETRSYEPRKFDNQPPTQEELSKGGRFHFLYLVPLAKHDCRFRLAFQSAIVPGDHRGQPINLQETSLLIETGNLSPSPYDVVMHP